MPLCRNLEIVQFQVGDVALPVPAFHYLEYFQKAYFNNRLVVRFVQFTMEKQVVDTFSLTFSRTGGRFELVVGDAHFSQTACEFMATFASMQGKDMEEYMANLTSDYDRIRVPLSGCGKSVTLSLPDFARLRTLYSQQMFELKLEDMLIRQGIARM